MKIAALYVANPGPYFRLDSVDPWDIERDARKYRGPHKVIAHPPCERWGKYWGGGPSVKKARLLGDDQGCFAHALWAVRMFGGVLEHPQGSHAWPWFGIIKPPSSGGWVVADEYGGLTCCVSQGHYGHKAQKATWLYAVGCKQPNLKWGKAEGKMRMEDGFVHTWQRKEARARGVKPVPRLSVEERINTPIKFRNLLIDIVRG